MKRRGRNSSKEVVTLSKRDRRTRENNEQTRSKENRSFFLHAKKTGKDFVENQIKIEASKLLPHALGFLRFPSSKSHGTGLVQSYKV
jgi:hypothetical protein